MPGPRSRSCPRSCSTELTDAGLEPLAIYDAIAEAIDEDLPEGYDDEDRTSAATIPADAQGVADFAAREPGVVAGLGVAAMVFHYVMGDDVSITDRVPDGLRVASGDALMRVTGPTRGLLTAERTALNFACHLSGVATATAAWVDALEGTGARVLDTRKTLPGLRDAAEVRRPLRRRHQPPDQPVGPGDGEGQPRDRRRRGGAGARGGALRRTPACGWRSR